MASLTQAAEQLSIEKRNTSDFSNSVTKKSCTGGLFKYATDKNYRRDNLRKNFEAGTVGRYNYSGENDGEIGPSMGKVPQGVGNAYGFSYLSKTNIGEGYVVDGTPSNAPLNFVTTEDFSDFEGQLMEEQMMRNRDEFYPNIKYHDDSNFLAEDYEAKVLTLSDTAVTTTMPFVPAGTRYSVNKPINYIANHEVLNSMGIRFRALASTYEKIIKEGTGKMQSYLFYQNIVPRGVFDYYSRITDGPNKQILTEGKSRDSVAMEKLEEYDALMRANLVAEKMGKNEVEAAHPLDYKLAYGDIFGLPDDEKTAVADSLINSVKIPSLGLEVFYTDVRDEYQDIEKLRKKCSDINHLYNDYINFLYKSGNSYGVEVTNSLETAVPTEGYTVSKDNGGTLLNINGKGYKTFVAYQETEKGNVPSLNVSTTDNSTVQFINEEENISKLLKKTNNLFKEGKINSLVNRFHTVKNENYSSDELISSYTDGYGLSRGRNLLKKNPTEESNGYDNPYCRVWTQMHQYAKLRDRIRPFYDGDNPMSIKDVQRNYGSLRPNGGAEHLNDYSVLQDNGFVRITPTQQEQAKKYMFSIENLAWRDSGVKLSSEQKGDNGGRIMWFPPYNLKFNEQVQTEWNGNKFIGRGEQIYTYVNTERTGNLSFTLLIDHPSIVNKWREGVKNDDTKRYEQEQQFLRYFAGCEVFGDEVDGTKIDSNKEDNGNDVNEKDDRNYKPEQKRKSIAYVVFFPNNFSGKDYFSDMSESISMVSEYETVGATSDPITYQDESIKNTMYDNDNENSTKHINENPDAEIVKDIRKMLLVGYGEDMEIRFLKGNHSLMNLAEEFTGTENFGVNAQTMKIEKIHIWGNASNHGTLKNNRQLCSGRRGFMKNIISTNGKAAVENDIFSEEKGNIYDVLKADVKGRNINTSVAKLARSGIAIFDITWMEDNVASAENGAPAGGTYETDDVKQVSGKNIIYVKEEKSEKRNELIRSGETQYTDFSYDNEYQYFEEIKKDGDIIYNNIVDKVKYFDPVFHSITPEGFNARLTFLQQCTRQGPTVSVSNANSESKAYLKYAGNLAFGRAPYCILRIGDFFNTKICIDSISIQYDTNNGVQWDLNPEGIGVQPMFADVNISFKFIGGQDIGGTIDVLQNAISNNYYANASVYDERAERGHGKSVTK